MTKEISEGAEKKKIEKHIKQKTKEIFRKKNSDIDMEN